MPQEYIFVLMPNSKIFNQVEIVNIYIQKNLNP